MKKIFLFLLCLVCIVEVDGTPISARRAEKLIQNFLSVNGSSLKSSTLNPTLILSDRGNRLRSTNATEASTYYVFSLSDERGFVILAADDDVYPILGYSFDMKFSTDSMPDNLTTWLSEYQRQIDWARTSEYTVSKDVQEAWTALNEGTFKLKSSGGKKLTTALWNQGSPYSLQCPNKTSSVGRMPAGCVATATGIIMKYHQWPDVGTGSHSYTSQTNKLKLSATYNTSYDWTNIKDEYVAGQYTSADADKIAKLISDIGIFCNMDYDNDASGAYGIDAAKGLLEYMKYDKGIQQLYRDNYQKPEWENLMIKEIDNNRPFMYSGTNSSKEGHQFVIDGYDGSGYFSVNWGWSGSYNGYFTIDALVPAGQGTGGNVGGFSYDQDMIIGIQKPTTNNAYNDVIILYAGDSEDGTHYAGLTTKTTSIQQNVPFDIAIGWMVNTGMRNFNGIVRVALTDSDGNIKEFITTNTPLEDMDNENVYAYEDECKITMAIESTDQIRVFYKSNDSNEWKWMRGDDNAPGYILITPISTANEKIEIPSSININYSQYGNIEITAEEEIQQITIYNLDGQLMNKRTPSRQNNISIDIDNYSKGLYFIEVKTATDRKVLKVLKR